MSITIHWSETIDLWKLVFEKKSWYKFVPNISAEPSAFPRGESQKKTNELIYVLPKDFSFHFYPWERLRFSETLGTIIL